MRIFQYFCNSIHSNLWIHAFCWIILFNNRLQKSECAESDKKVKISSEQITLPDTKEGVAFFSKYFNFLKKSSMNRFHPYKKKENAEKENESSESADELLMFHSIQIDTFKNKIDEHKDNNMNIMIKKDIKEMNLMQEVKKPEETTKYYIHNNKKDNREFCNITENKEENNISKSIKYIYENEYMKNPSLISYEDINVDSEEIFLQKMKPVIVNLMESSNTDKNLQNNLKISCISTYAHNILKKAYCTDMNINMILFKDARDPIKKLHNFVIKYNYLFKQCDESKNIYELLGSFDIFIMLTSLLFILSNERVRNEACRIRRKVKSMLNQIHEMKKEKNGGLSYCFEKPWILPNVFSFRKNPEVTLSYDIIENVLFIEEGDEHNNEYNIIAGYKEIVSRQFYILNNAIIPIRKCIYQLGKIRRINYESIYIISKKRSLENLFKLINTIEDFQNKIKTLINTKCEEDRTLIHHAYNIIRNLMGKRLMLDSKDPEEILCMVTSYKKISDVLDKFGVAIQLLNLSENKNYPDASIIKPKGLSYLLIHYIQLQLLLILSLKIKINLEAIFNFVDVRLLRGSFIPWDPIEFNIIISHYEEIVNFSILGNKFMNACIKREDYIREIFMMYHMLDDINNAAINLKDTILEIQRKTDKQIENKKNSSYLYKRIITTCKSLNNLLTLLFT